MKILVLTVEKSIKQEMMSQKKKIEKTQKLTITKQNENKYFKHA